MLKLSLAEKVPKFSKKMNNHYLDCLTSHLNEKQCKSCKLDKGIIDRCSFQTSVEVEYTNQWPQQHPLKIYPLLNQEHQSIRFTFPSSIFFIPRKHTTEKSHTVLFKTTQVKPKMLKGRLAYTSFKWARNIILGSLHSRDLIGVAVCLDKKFWHKLEIIF